MNDFLHMLWTQTWQIALLAVVVGLCTRAIARNRPHLAHALWLLVIIKCVTPPMWGHSLGVFSQLQALTTLDEKTSDSALEVIPFSKSESAFPLSFSDAPETASHLEPDLAVHQSTQPVARHEDSAATNVTPIPTHQVPELKAVDAIRPDRVLRPGLLLSILAIGASATLSLMIFRCLRCLRCIHRHRTSEFDDLLNERLQMLSKKLRLRRRPRIIVSDVLFGPAVLGVLRHTIVLPRCLIEAENAKWKAVDTAENAASLSALSSPLSSLDPILAHELLHIRRGDLRTGLLQAIVQSLWWFHPAVWFCNRWLSREAERCCDEQVIAELGCSPAQYARSLLSVIESKHALQPIPVFPGMKPVEITTQRMERIMSLKTDLKKQTPVWCWLAVAALAFVVLPGAVAKTTRHDEPSVLVPLIDEPRSHESHGDSKVSSKQKGQVRLRAFKGNTFSSDRDLREHLLSKRSVWNLIGEAFEPGTIQADTEALKDYYRNVGFFDVEVTGEALFSLDRSSVCLVYTLTEGRQYRLREILCEGNKRIVSSDLLGEIVLKPGDHYNAAEVAEGVRRMRDRYIRADDNPPQINPVPRFNEEMGILDLVFEIEETDEYPISTPAFEPSVTTYLERVTNPSIGVVVGAGDTVQDMSTPSAQAVESKVHATPETIDGSDKQPLVLLSYPVGELILPILSAKPDFAPLVELIKSTIEPDSWSEDAGQIVISHPDTLVIRQTPQVHDRIAKLLSQLLDDIDQVCVRFQLMKISSDIQLKGIQTRCSLHPMQDNREWALLTKERSEEIVKFLTSEKAQVFKWGAVTMFSGTTGQIRLGSSDGASNGLTILLGPRVIADIPVIRLLHSIDRSSDPEHDVVTRAMQDFPINANESLIGSGQTLMLLVDTNAESPGDQNDVSKPDPQSTKERFVVLLTVQRIEAQPVQ